MRKGAILLFVIFSTIFNFSYAQNVEILSYNVNTFGQVELEIEAQANQYYLLTALHEPTSTYESITSITLGVDGNMIISEPLSAFPLQNYKITAHSIADPDDTDGDGIDDITEFNDMPTLAPLNFAKEIPFEDGSTSVNNGDVFSELGVISSDIPWAPFLNNQEFVKFVILNQNTDQPSVYFINSKTHEIHAEFIATLDSSGDEYTTGEVVYNPNQILPNGVIGAYSFNYSFGDAYNFEYTQRTFELLAANMPYLQNNLLHFIGENAEASYINSYSSDYEGSRITVVLESDFFADVDFIPFNQAEGFGFFRHMQLDENPGSRDIVLYDALPNSLPRVGGIITSVVQTPLSHVNLRAIQDNVPNAYIKEPLGIDSISNLIGKYIYYRVENESYHIREASLEEVNEWYEKLRPTEEQIPERDLSQTSILPLDEISFDMANAFGAKCSNVATMRNFGFPEGTIPNGFGIPFYYYDEFMKFNGFYDRVNQMINDPEFISDLETRIDMLKDFRKEIKDADMPQWMLDDLQAMHDAFPEGTAVRCRSSTNNEDLPGFSGAGLYTSKTQHLDEGHISKSVKQVYASMWNFRAFDERDFYRVDHYIAAMGILCHPNYQDEKSNGVGVSLDPIYQTVGNFYLNTQVGESLITNPDANSVPEEILLNEDPDQGYFVLRSSNLVPHGELVMDEQYLDLMRSYLRVIHDEFEILYNVVGAEGFGMDIEYKVTKDDRLIIKQARPWVSFWADIKATFDLAVEEILEPQNSADLGDAELVTAKIANRGLRPMKDFEISLLVEDQVIETIMINDELPPQNSAEYQFSTPIDFSTIGDYNIAASVSHTNDGYERNDTLRKVLSKLHLLEAEMVSISGVAKCGEEVEVTAKVVNNGASTFSQTEIEVWVNGMAVDTFQYDFSIPYQVDVEMSITITENLKQTNNEITLNIISVNGQQDAIMDNNASTFFIDLDAENKKMTFNIDSDDYPEEISWEIYDVVTSQLVDSGFLSELDFNYSRKVCLSYNTCYTLYVYDSFGDGMCCEYGEGSFELVNDLGETLLTQDGNFNSEAKVHFCPDPDICLLTAEYSTTNASTNTSFDGEIIIEPKFGEEPYLFSIDGGNSFVSNNTFTDLAAAVYAVQVKDASENCIIEEDVEVGFDQTSSTDELTLRSIKLYPNPTNEQFIISIDKTTLVSDRLNIEIYDAFGRLIMNNSISGSEIKPENIVSLKGYDSGSYIVKCFSKSFEKHFKLIKM